MKGLGSQRIRELREHVEEEKDAENQSTVSRSGNTSLAVYVTDFV